MNLKIKRAIPVLAVVVSIALVASACSGTENNVSRSASAAAGNPVDLPALSSTSATGERVPLWFGAVVTPASWVSSSLSPTLSLPAGTTGAWTFKLSDLSAGTSAFGTREYRETGSTARIPLGLLEQNTTYMWSAESPGQSPVAGSFTVDTQLSGVQSSDAASGLRVSLGSGEASFAWASHSMQSIGGPVGITLQFQGSNIAASGIPAGWALATSSGSPYLSVITRPDGSVGLVSQNGQVSSYQRGQGNSWSPVKMAGDVLDTSGLAPTLLQNADQSWSVTSKASTSRFVDDNGDGTANLAGVSADGAPMLEQQWVGGLLRKVSDPVSGRSIELVYGGGSCPKPVAGFIDAPNDQLCQVKFWDGSTSAFSYIALPDGSSTIGRLVDYPEAGAEGAQVSDLSFDAAGRISRVRSPLVASAAASSVVNPDDAQFFAEVGYTPEGRVASITEPASSAGAKRCIRSYENVGAQTSVADSCLGKVVQVVMFDGTTFFPIVTTNAAGQEQTNTWDFATGDLLSTVDSTGRVTRNSFSQGQLVATQGPSRDLSNAQVALRQYDESYAQSPEGIAMRGLDVVYWPSATERGVDAVQELGPIMNDVLVPSLVVNWSASPAGNSTGGWSALLTGTLKISTPGAYSFASGNSTARLRVANIACEAGGCNGVQLPAGPVALSIELTANEQAASLDVTWSGPDTGGSSTAIPTDRLSPQYGFATETKIVDPDAIRSNGESVTRSSYANPSLGLVTSRANTAGTTSAISYEGAGWNRPTLSVLPAGNAVRQVWWGEKESSTAPCPGAKAAVQGGAIKQSITPGSNGGDGPSSQQWYTAAGALAASKLSGGGATQCLSYDKSGRLLGVEILGLSESSKLVINYAVGGNPLKSSVTETKGSTTTVSSSETDLAGRVIQSTDRFGIVTVTSYDERTGAVSSTMSTPPGGASIITVFAYDEFGRPTTTTIDGRLVASTTYGDFGLPNSVTYGNGARTNFSFNAQNEAVLASTIVAGRSYSSSKVVSAAGITSSSTLAVEGRSSTFEYTHDTNGRLSAVTLSAGLVADSRTWAYSYDANSNRTSQTATVNGVESGSYVYTYDQADRLVTTSDPAAQAGIAYDDRGNSIEVGPNSFVYDGANLMTSVSDGTTTVSYDRAVDGSVIGKTTKTPTSEITVRFGSGGIVLNDQGQATAHIASLPGGVQITRTLGAIGSSEWAFSALSGDRFFTVDDAGTQIGTVSAFNPFGEQVLGTAAINGSVPDLTWRAGEGNETIALATTVVAMGQRVYVPALGRFLQVDPMIGGSANGYDYANQDPTSFADPSGNADASLTDWLGMAIVALAAVATSLVMPSGSGALLNACAAASAGMFAGVINMFVQKAIGGDSVMAVASIGVGALAGIVSGGIAGKVKWAKSLREPTTVSSKPSSMVKWLKEEGEWTASNDAVVETASIRASARQTLRAPLQANAGTKAAQAPVANNVVNPPPMKLSARAANGGQGRRLIQENGADQAVQGPETLKHLFKQLKKAGIEGYD